MTRERLEHHDAEGVEVAARIGLASQDLLGAQVVGRALDAGQAFEAARAVTQPGGITEVDERGVAVLVDDDVLRLHVAMHDAGGMDSGQALGHVAAPASHVGMIDGSLVDDLAEASPGRVREHRVQRRAVEGVVGAALHTRVTARAWPSRPRVGTDGEARARRRCLRAPA